MLTRSLFACNSPSNGIKPSKNVSFDGGALNTSSLALAIPGSSSFWMTCLNDDEGDSGSEVAINEFKTSFAATSYRKMSFCLKNSSCSSKNCTGSSFSAEDGSTFTTVSYTCNKSEASSEKSGGIVVAPKPRAETGCMNAMPLPPVG